jgi:ribosomal protein S18 acetylase RimI-like enzyme
METHVREARSADAVWYVNHVRALLAEPGVPVPLRPDEYLVTPEQQAELLAGAAARGDLYLIAEIHGAPVGELNLRRGNRAAFKHSAVLGMSVASPWRNRRIGSLLMEHAIGWARSNDKLRRIELYVYESNEPAIRLYERFGFCVEGRRRSAVRVGERYIDDLMMAYHMIR